MAEIKYVIKDATCPIGDGKKLIIHVCNDIGGWGRGFVTALSKKWKAPEAKYRLWAKRKPETFKLGNIQAVKVESDIAVINMIAQRDIKSYNGVPPIRYKALESCLVKVADIAEKYSASVHCPYLMGCDLAGGKWDRVEAMIIELICSRDLEVVCYDLFGKRKTDKSEVHEKEDEDDFFELNFE